MYKGIFNNTSFDLNPHPFKLKTRSFEFNIPSFKIKKSFIPKLKKSLAKVASFSETNWLG
jgi:hypothetical protein